MNSTLSPSTDIIITECYKLCAAKVANPCERTSTGQQLIHGYLLHIFHCEANGINDLMCQHFISHQFHFSRKFIGFKFFRCLFTSATTAVLSSVLIPTMSTSQASFPFLACHHEPILIYSSLSAIFCRNTFPAPALNKLDNPSLSVRRAIYSLQAH